MRLGALALEGDGEDGFSLVRLEDALEGKDGGAFVEEVGKVNEALRGMKVGGRMERGGVGWEAGRVPGGLACRIMEEHYQRCILPEAASLRSYKPWSNGTYGELLPGLVHDIIVETRLGPKCHFVDLGSGVGNVCMQVSLETGCGSFGIEVRGEAARVGSASLSQVEYRAWMWGVKMGKVELEEGDMVNSKKAQEQIQGADVILLNNKAFDVGCELTLLPEHRPSGELTDKWSDGEGEGKASHGQEWGDGGVLRPFGSSGWKEGGGKKGESM
jgi:H3 lysine-79-specific histone-lysine N-methyltransferase